MHIVYFTGIKHSGKTELGRSVSAIFSMDHLVAFFDLDALVLKQLPGEYPTVREFYREKGKEAFMRLEAQALEKFLKGLEKPETLPGECTVFMATGGGICDNPEAIHLMCASGKIVYLKCREDVLYSRILKDGIPPFLDPMEPKESFHRLFIDRDGRYGNIADIVIQLYGSNTIVENSTLIVEKLKKHMD